MPVTYELSRRAVEPVTPPVLDPDPDPDQRAVVEHPGGPLLVLAGPGTGKTTTLVELVAARVESGALRPDQALVLTFGRRAADELRTRVARRLARTTAAPMATTFHAFCYALVRRFGDPDAFARPVQLLSAPERDVRVREVLAGSTHTGRVGWPPSLRPALRTAGLAEELQRFVARAREQRLDPADVVAAGRAAGRPEWVAAGQFMEEYLEVLDAEQALDYPELVHRAVLLCQDARIRDTLRAELPLVVVDEYQDTDPSQVALLRALAGDGGDLVVVGDPDQSIYTFRGADVGGLWRFPTDFPCADGTPAPVRALGTTRRFGARLLAASRAVLAGTGVRGAVSREVFDRFRHPACDCPHGPGEVAVRTFGSPAAEAETIADLLRRAHLDEGLAWSQMAVLVRTTDRLSRLQRALGAAGVPVEVAGDEAPLRAEPAVRTLLLGLRAVEHLSRRAEPLDPQLVTELLRGPLGGLDPAVVRRLGTVLRRGARERADLARMTEADPHPVVPPSEVLLAQAVSRPGALAVLPGPEAARAHRLAQLLAGAGRLLRDGAAPEQVLWSLWTATGWPGRLRKAVDRGGDGARSAHRDLDAVCALFDRAARAEEQQQRRGIAGLLAELDAQQIPAQQIRPGRPGGDGGRPAAVRLLTAHRAKGLEWRLVVVAGVQEGEWPDLRARGSLLQADRLDRHGAVPSPPRSALLAEERRLFYVAVTRARQRLVVTAVAGAAADGEQPSRFLSALGVAVGAPEPRPRRPLSLPAVTAELRVLAETGATERVRGEAARRLARLAAARRPDGSALVRAAAPEHWWGLPEVTHAPAPLRPAAEPLTLSGSGLESLTGCPLRWFLDRESAGARQASTAQGFGTVVHVLAEAVATGVLAPDAAALRDRLDDVWTRLAFAAPWVADQERAQAQAVVERFVAWHAAERGREVAGTEVEFSVEVPVAAGGRRETVVLRGRLDRVEVSGDGLVHVVDLKTARSAPTGPQVDEHQQLGVYQLAVAHGAADKVLDAPAEVGGAELVQLRHPSARGAAGADRAAGTDRAAGAGADRAAGLPKVQRQRPATARADGVPPVQAQLADAVRTLREEDFVARPGPGCRTCDFRTLCPAQPQGRTLLAPVSDVRAAEEDP